MGKEQNSFYYDTLYNKATHYHKKWNEMGNWTIIWEKSLPIIKENNVKSILDIGSGMGQFGELCQNNNISYKGIDFSKYAIDYSNKNSTGNQIFECVDAYDYHYKDDVDCYVTHEFLEHIEFDTNILSKLKPNKLIIFSVPSFNDPGHVRHFKNIDEIKLRYSPYIDDLRVEAITKAIHYLGCGITK